MATVLIRITEDAITPDEVTVEQFIHDFKFTPDTTDADLPPALQLAALILQNVDNVRTGTSVEPDEGIEVPGRGRSIRETM